MVFPVSWYVQCNYYILHVAVSIICNFIATEPFIYRKKTSINFLSYLNITWSLNAYLYSDLTSHSFRNYSKILWTISEGEVTIYFIFISIHWRCGLKFQQLFSTCTEKTVKYIIGDILDHILKLFENSDLTRGQINLIYSFGIDLWLVNSHSRTAKLIPIAIKIYLSIWIHIITPSYDSQGFTSRDQMSNDDCTLILNTAE